MKRSILRARIGSECVFVGRYNTGLKIQTETVSKILISKTFDGNIILKAANPTLGNQEPKALFPIASRSGSIGRALRVPNGVCYFTPWCKKLSA